MGTTFPVVIPLNMGSTLGRVYTATVPHQCLIAAADHCMADIPEIKCTHPECNLRKAAARLLWRLTIELCSCSWPLHPRLNKFLLSSDDFCIHKHFSLFLIVV